MPTTQYIGSRYVPIFADPVEWSSTKKYEPLTIVTHNGNSYTSRQFVPVGIDIDNEEFWALTGNYNAQVEIYRQQVASYHEDIEQYQQDIESYKDTVEQYFDSLVFESPSRYNVPANGDATDAISTIIEKGHGVYLDANYQVDSIETNKPIVIIGNGFKLSAIGDGTAPMFRGSKTGTNTDNRLVYIKDCIFDGMMDDYTDAGKCTMALACNRCSNVKISNCTFKNTQEDGFYIGGVVYGSVNNCTFKNIGTLLYRTTRNGFSLFSWYIYNENNIYVSSQQVDIIGNTFVDITDEGFRVDDFRTTNIERNSFANIGQYAMEPTFDYANNPINIVINIIGNRIDNTGSTPINFDFKGSYSQPNRTTSVVLEDNYITNAGKCTRFTNISAHLGVLVNIYQTSNTLSLRAVGNTFIKNYVSEYDADWVNYYFYLNKVSDILLEGNTFIWDYDLEAPQTAKFAIFRLYSSANVRISHNRFDFAYYTFTLFRFDGCSNISIEANTIDINNAQYVCYYNNCSNIRIVANEINMATAEQHMFLLQAPTGAVFFTENHCTLGNHSSSHFFMSCLGSVALGTMIFTLNSFGGIANNLIYPTTGWTAQYLEGNV